MRRKWTFVAGLLVGLVAVFLGASPPYNLDITHPGDNDIPAVFPANERTFRDNINSWMQQNCDPTSGYCFVQSLTTTNKLALVTPPTGMLVYDTTLAALQINNGSPSSPTWANVISTTSFVSSVNVADATNGGLSCSGGPITSSGTILCKLVLNDLITKVTPAANDLVAIYDSTGLASSITTVAAINGCIGDGSATHFLNGQGNCVAIGTSSGTLTAGTTNTLSPFTAGTSHSVAHGLGVAPQVIHAWLQCISASCDGNYANGDQIDLGQINFPGSSNAGNDSSIAIEADTSNTRIVTTGSSPYIVSKTGASMAQITPSKWEVVVVPYKVN